MLAMPTHPHIHLRNLGGDGIAFRPYSGGSKTAPEPIKDRAGHARQLRKGLRRVADEMPGNIAAQEAMGVPKKWQGVTVSAVGLGSQELWLGDMKSTSPGFSLLAANPSAGNKPARANFFISKSSLETLEDQLDGYENYRDKRNGEANKKPQRFSLFESVSEFSVAKLSDVWRGTQAELPDLQTKNIEIWFRAERAEYFYRAIERIKKGNVGNPTKFIDNIVIDIELNRAQMDSLLVTTGAIIEFRPSSHFITDYRKSNPEQRHQTSTSIAARVVAASRLAPRTVILDSGVNALNPLLLQSLPPELCKTVNSDWGTEDDIGHGTNMAGVALFPNLQHSAASSDPITLSTGLESVKIVRPIDSTDKTAPREAIQQAVRLVERDVTGGRVFSLSATIPGEDEDGRQSATSAAMDQLAWNDGNRTRLFCVAAGNVPASEAAPYQVGHYSNRNEEFPVQSPAQALNVLTVGAYTTKTGRSSVAPEGDLCPVSRTSQAWPHRQRSANKPDVVFEGGNHIFDPGKQTSRSTPQTRVLTTGPSPDRILDLTGETSAATAGIAGLATRVMARYPQMRPETIRGLIINGAAWTPAMKAQAQGSNETRRRALDRFGWGVPNETSILESASNSLTLVIEDELTPFGTRDGRAVLKEMKYFGLPWPADELARLNTTEVQMACTLSYFVEPDPLADKRARRDRYSSHRLRFRLNQAGDTPHIAQSRVNQLVEADDDVVFPTETDKNWLLDLRRSVIGTVHHNVWRGPAHELAVRGGISIYPVKGWWAERKSPEYRRSVPFSLIISIKTERTDVDLYAEAMATIPPQALVVHA